MIDRNLGREAMGQWRLTAIVAGLGMAGGILAVLQAAFLSQIINGVFLEAKDLAAVRQLLIVLAAIIFIRAGSVWLEGVLAFRLATVIKVAVRQRLASHILHLGPVALSHQSGGELINVLGEGVENLEAYFSRYLPQLVRAAIIPALILLVVGPLDITSALIMLVTAPMIPVFMILIGRLAERMNVRQWAVMQYLSAHFLDVLNGLLTLKVFNRSREQAEVIARLSGQFRDATMEVLKVAFLSALALELLATISTALVAVTMGIRLLYGDITFYSAFFVLLLAPEYYLPLRQLGTHFHAGLAGKTSAADIFRLLSLTGGGLTGGSASLPVREKVSIGFREVSFTYPGKDRPAIERLSFHLEPGEKVALVGPSGAGKSTVISLLLGFIVPDAGMITVNNIRLSDMNRSDWLKNVAVVPQRPHLFFGTVAENIRLGKPAAAMDEVMAAARLAGVHDFVLDLPQGYDTVVGEGGRGLSGGEGQRLAIARAFLKDAPVIILDEAASSLDPATESAVQAAMDKLLVGRTALIIAHRLTTVRQVDRILAVSEGKIAESGSHRELMAYKGLYYQLVTAFKGDYDLH
ncbi:MAG TPA: thiol reductant ABC exporter subunit CydD [Methylomusa anaerophila]|uniref:ATP-binding/permease protein CydD n=1 Tax=Methylomusa anaerophila TaxID=1930071 RepID=A0A348AH06_9FIRM|nr:thiol reductant ABC exporter subunit CydD [Methylomusa anaerophila]BBB90354.1 ATP-binding/permease protein CydD [Methylomusa anaerophila]HML89300.1 thiol reductant ABC exporter subunit CydD [Methylomusa anaerophila]